MIFMSRNKSEIKKKRLGKALRQNKRIPVFVAVKTKRRITQNRMQRNWRTQKLDLKDEEAQNPK